MEKESFTQPLMMRRDYGKEEDKKDKVIIKEVPIMDYDVATNVSATSRLGEKEIEDYDSYSCNNRCSGSCFLCDR